MSFAESLRQLRQQAGLTQIALAQRAGLSLRSVQNWEQGHRIPRLDTVISLTKALRVSVDRLILLENRHTSVKQHNKQAVTDPKPYRRRKRQ
jgi:transcriptional regulator with XRE-family HTH domain